MHEGIVRVARLVVTSIDVVTPFNSFTSYVDIANEFQGISKELFLQDYINDDSENMRGLCRVLCSNSLSSPHSFAAQHFPTIEEGEIFLRKIIQRFSSGRSLFRSIDGHVGLAPMTTKPGGMVTVLLGSDPAMILRPTLNGKYLAIGEACHSMIIDGAALLGPLPDHFEAVFGQNERTGERYWAFFDRESRSFQVEDLRLVDIPLPKGWRRIEHVDEDFWIWFVNDDTGSSVDCDPRLSPEVLKSRGVKIEQFHLI
jgi:hypothetical protein